MQTANILKSIEEQTELFLEDNVSLKIIKKQTSNGVYKNSTSIDLFDDNNSYKVIISMDDNLLQEVLMQLLKEDVDDSEREDVYKDLIDEVINIIVGLSIKHFSPKYRNLELSTPAKLQEKELENIINLKSQNFEIVTPRGVLSFFVLNNPIFV